MKRVWTFRFNSLFDIHPSPGQLLKECGEALSFLFEQKGGLKVEEEIIKPLSQKVPD